MKRIKKILIAFTILFATSVGFILPVNAASDIEISYYYDVTFPVEAGQEIEISVKVSNLASKPYEIELNTVFGRTELLSFVDGSVMVNDQASSEYNYSTNQDGFNRLSYSIESIAANSEAIVKFKVTALADLEEFLIYTDGSFRVLTGIGAGTIIPVLARYAVNYHANDGSDQVVVGGQYHLDEAFNVNENSFVSSDGSVFVGWNTASDGNGEDISENESFFMPGREVNLYAMWEAPVVQVNTYTIEYHANAGEDSVTFTNRSLLMTTTHTENEVVSIHSDNPIRTGYDFVEWNTTSDGNGVSYAPGHSFMIQENVVVYAIWEEEEVIETPSTPEEPVVVQPTPTEPTTPTAPSVPNTAVSSEVSIWFLIITLILVSVGIKEYGQKKKSK